MKFRLWNFGCDFSVLSRLGSESVVRPARFLAECCVRDELMRVNYFCCVLAFSPFVSWVVLSCSQTVYYVSVNPVIGGMNAFEKKHCYFILLGVELCSLAFFIIIFFLLFKMTDIAETAASLRGPRSL